MRESFDTNLKKASRWLGRVKRRILSRHLITARITLVFLVLSVLVALFMGARYLANASGLSELITMAGNFMFLPEGIVETREDRTNILLLGKAGKDPELTDTMILASVGRAPADTVLISIPRDIWVAEFEDKINGAYFRGNEREPGGGLVLAKSLVEEVVGVPIHYALAFNFDEFVAVVDILGGVEVNVERAFTDGKFPIPGKENNECEGDPEFLCRHETVRFEQGLQFMDGETALKFARSRQSEDPAEGTDLARAARQQKVLLSIKSKVLSSDTLFSPKKLSALWSAFWSTTETDLTKPQLAYIARLIYDTRNLVSSYTIPEDLLFNPPYSPAYNNLYVFTPKDGDWGRVHEWVLSIF